MSVHPKFDIEHSHCGNCAAFNGTVEGNDPRGACHRFAPRPTAILTHFPESGPRTETNPRGFSWPMVEDEFWCLDWFPRKDATPASDESLWRAFFASLSARAKGALCGIWVDAAIRSFAQLDAMPDRALLKIHNVGVTTVAEIREKRKAFPGGPTK